MGVLKVHLPSETEQALEQYATDKGFDSDSMAANIITLFLNNELGTRVKLDDDELADLKARIAETENDEGISNDEAKSQLLAGLEADRLKRNPNNIRNKASA